MRTDYLCLQFRCNFTSPSWVSRYIANRGKWKLIESLLHVEPQSLSYSFLSTKLPFRTLQDISFNNPIKAFYLLDIANYVRTKDDGVDCWWFDVTLCCRNFFISTVFVWVYRSIFPHRLRFTIARNLRNFSSRLSRRGPESNIEKRKTASLEGHKRKRTVSMLLLVYLNLNSYNYMLQFAYIIHRSLTHKLAFMDAFDLTYFYYSIFGLHNKY